MVGPLPTKGRDPAFKLPDNCSSTIGIFPWASRNRRTRKRLAPARVGLPWTADLAPRPQSSRHRVEVRIQIQRAPKPLGERHRAAAGIRVSRLSGLLAVPALHRAQEDREGIREQLAVVASR